MPSTFNTSSVYGTYLVPKTELVNSSVLRTEELPKIRNFGARLVSRAKEKRAYLGPASRAQPDEQKWPWRKSGLLARKSSNMHKRRPAIGHHTGPNPLNCRISMEIVSILRFGDGLDGGGCSLERTCLHLISLINRENTGNISLYEAIMMKRLL